MSATPVAIGTGFADGAENEKPCLTAGLFAERVGLRAHVRDSRVDASKLVVLTLMT
jgi:hypothetical protein